MRRLLILVAVLVFVDTMLYAALTPLLPHFAHELGLSKTHSGVLVAAYAAGALAGGLPGGMAAVRFGARRAVLVGLTLMTLSSIGFAFADSYWTLFAARFLQGLGSGFTWAGAFAWLLAAAPRETRGELIGKAMAAAVGGALCGPVVGAAAALAGRATIFCALAGLSVLLAAWTSSIADVHTEAQPSTAIGRALRDGRFLGGLGAMALASLLFGILSTLGPLHLSAAGFGAAAIGAVWLTSAAFEAVESPYVGRLSDRRGPVFPVQLALAGGVVVSLALATGARPLVYAPLVVLAGIAYGALFTPAFALIADGAETVGLAQGMAFGLMNAGWALGAVVGPAAAGAIASATGDWIPFVLAAALCGGSLAATLRAERRRAAGVRVRAASGG